MVNFGPPDSTWPWYDECTDSLQGKNKFRGIFFRVYYFCSHVFGSLNSERDHMSTITLESKTHWTRINIRYLISKDISDTLNFFRSPRSSIVETMETEPV